MIRGQGYVNLSDETLFVVQVLRDRSNEADIFHLALSIALYHFWESVAGFNCA